LRANFRAFDRQLTTNARRTVKRNGDRLLELIRAYVAFDTGRMLRLAKVTYSPSGLVFEGGWDAADFYKENEPFYPPFVELGTYRQAAQPSVLPAWQEIQGRLRDEIARDMRRSANRV
jgi:hypothetical protein